MESAFSFAIAAMPSWLAILITAGVPVAMAIFLGTVMQTVFTPQEFAANAATGATKYGFVVEIYAVVAALALVGGWDIYQNQRDILQKEATGIYMLALSVDTFDGPAFEENRQEMRAAIRNYASSVVSIDWPQMQVGQSSTGSEAAYQRLVRAFFDVDGETSGQTSLQQNIPVWIADVAESRIARLSVMSRSLSTLIWVLVLTCSVSVIVFQWFFAGGSMAMNFAMGSVISLIVGAVLLVAIKLAHPFVGDPALLTPRPFLALMEVT